MKQYKTVKEVCHLTGLTRKHLYYFHHANVVRAVAHANYSVEGNDGYKLYDEKAVEKLLHIALCYRLGLRRNEIRDMMLAPDYNSYALVDTLLLKAKQRQDQLHRQITVLERLKTQEPLSPALVADTLNYLETNQQEERT